MHISLKVCENTYFRYLFVKWILFAGHWIAHEMCVFIFAPRVCTLMLSPTLVTSVLYHTKSKTFVLSYNHGVYIRVYILYDRVRTDITDVGNRIYVYTCVCPIPAKRFHTHMYLKS